MRGWIGGGPDDAVAYGMGIRTGGRSLRDCPDGGSYGSETAYRRLRACRNRDNPAGYPRSSAVDRHRRSDTGRGDRLQIDHVLASCGYFPDFPTREIDGRVLADGGYVANAPLQPLIEEVFRADERLTCLVIDLYSSRGRAPASLTQAMARRNELIFGNQTRARLAAR